jgi:hypothetical protein
VLTDPGLLPGDLITEETKRWECPEFYAPLRYYV